MGASRRLTRREPTLSRSGACGVGNGGRMGSGGLAGRLLVATPALVDGNFALSVVLVLDHSTDGAVGVVLNRPSDIDVADLVSGWGGRFPEPPVLFSGGPVQPDAVLALGSPDQAGHGTHQVLPGVAVVELPAAAEADFPVRIFAGYAGWGARQLDAEVAAGGWFVLDAVVEDVFTGRPEGLWRAVLTRQGGFFRTISEDPSRN